MSYSTDEGSIISQSKWFVIKQVGIVRWTEELNKSKYFIKIKKFPL